MKVALVHDYLKEYGGAERVLEALCELYPDAPIYTAFYKVGSAAHDRFKNREIIASWVQKIPFFVDKLHSPLRFLTPWIWGKFDFSKYDVVITSASWYVTKGVIPHSQKMKSSKPVEICYCHTPPRWLYGYKTSIEWQKFWSIKVYGHVVGHFMRLYDFNASQRVDYFIANSKEVQARIKKFYRRDAKVIYPPVSLPLSLSSRASTNELSDLKIAASQAPRNDRKKDYYFVVARIVGGKGLALAVEAANRLGFKLKIAGEPAGYYTEYKKLAKMTRHPGEATTSIRSKQDSIAALQNDMKGDVEFLGRVSDEELVGLYSGAKAFLALATDEDFGITPVEAQLCGTPVIAYNGGGYKETVVEGKTGVFFNESTVDSLTDAISRFEGMKLKAEDCRKNAARFSKERFKTEIQLFVSDHSKK